MINIAIASTKLFYEKSLPILIPSLIDSGIKKNKIHVFISGFDIFKKYIKDEITYYELNHNSFEYSPLIEIVEKNIESKYWFLIHDTCKAGPNFKKLIYNIPNTNPDKISPKLWPSMSIGLYKYEYLLSVKDKIISIKNTDYSKESLLKWKNWGAPNEDYILWKTEPCPVLYGNGGWEIHKMENWYQTKTIRRTEYLPSIDLYKNKSNWGHLGYNMELNI